MILVVAVEYLVIDQLVYALDDVLAVLYVERELDEFRMTHRFLFAFVTPL